MGFFGDLFGGGIFASGKSDVNSYDRGDYNMGRADDLKQEMIGDEDVQEYYKKVNFLISRLKLIELYSGERGKNEDIKNIFDRYHWDKISYTVVDFRKKLEQWNFKSYIQNHKSAINWLKTFHYTDLILELESTSRLQTGKAGTYRNAMDQHKMKPKHSDTLLNELLQLVDKAYEHAK